MAVKKFPCLAFLTEKSMERDIDPPEVLRTCKNKMKITLLAKLLQNNPHFWSPFPNTFPFLGEKSCFNEKR